MPGNRVQVDVMASILNTRTRDARASLSHRAYQKNLEQQLVADIARDNRRSQVIGMALIGYAPGGDPWLASCCWRARCRADVEPDHDQAAADVLPQRHERLAAP